MRGWLRGTQKKSGTKGTVEAREAGPHRQAAECEAEAEVRTEREVREGEKRGGGGDRACDVLLRDDKRERERERERERGWTRGRTGESGPEAKARKRSATTVLRALSPGLRSAGRQAAARASEGRRQGGRVERTEREETGGETVSSSLSSLLSRSLRMRTGAGLDEERRADRRPPRNRAHQPPRA